MKIYVSKAHGRGFFKPILKDLFHINKYSNFELHRDKSLKTPHKRCLVFKVGDKKILLDGNNIPSPTLDMMGKNTLGEYSLIIKLQYKKHEVWNNCPIPITSWSFSEKTYGLFRNSKDSFDILDKTFDCGFIGRAGGRLHQDRFGMVKGFSDLKNTDCFFWGQKERRENTLPLKDYLSRVIKWKSGFAPIGTKKTGNDGKTWREIEYAALGMPMIMENSRNYWVPLKPYEHYIPIINSNIGEALEQVLKDKEIGKRLYQWYLEACSEKGMCKTFVEIINKYI